MYKSYNQVARRLLSTTHYTSPSTNSLPVMFVSSVGVRFNILFITD